MIANDECGSELCVAVMKVLIVDDHPLVISGCTHLLEDAGVAQFLSATNAAEGYRLYRQERPDVVIVDLSMQSDNYHGLQFIRRLRDHEWQTPIIVFSMHADPGVVTRAVQLGATAYVLKDAPAGEFQQAFRNVVAGERYMSEALARQMAFAKTNDGGLLSHLTQRELETLSLIAEGRTHEFIADELQISRTTIVHTITSLKRKLDAATFNDLVRAALSALPIANGAKRAS